MPWEGLEAVRCIAWLWFTAPVGGRSSNSTDSQQFKTYPIGFFHIDIAEVRTQEGKLYLYVAIDRTSKFAFVQLVEKADTVTSRAFLDALVAAVPYKIKIVLTDNGIQFADLPKNRSGPTARWRGHPFARAVSVHECGGESGVGGGGHRGRWLRWSWRLQPEPRSTR
jgi:hypothetical protein